MTTRYSLFVVVAAIAFAVAAPTSFAFAQQDTAKVTKTEKKVVVHKKRHVAKRGEPSAYPELEPFRSFGFVGKYPGSCAAQQAAGTCVIDLGYGRCAPCSMGDGGFN